MIELKSALISAFHRDLATPAWLESLAVFVTGRVSPKRFNELLGEGFVKSSWNEERFMGPMSVVRYQFRTEFRCCGPLDIDHYSHWMKVNFDPELSEFQSVDSREKNHRHGHVSAALQRRGDSLARFRKIRCGACGGPLKISIYPEGLWYWVDCPNHQEELDPGEKMPDRLIALGWWRDFVADRTCPKCHSDQDVVGIKQGMPRSYSNSIWTGTGDLVGPEDSRSRWHCRSCRHKFR